jgi:TPR repeat protein
MKFFLANLVFVAALVLLSGMADSSDFDKDLAEWEKALTASGNGDLITALAEWQTLAEQGSIEAQFLVALMYYRGRSRL